MLLLDLRNSEFWHLIEGDIVQMNLDSVFGFYYRPLLPEILAQNLEGFKSF